VFCFTNNKDMARKTKTKIGKKQTSKKGRSRKASAAASPAPSDPPSLQTPPLNQVESPSFAKQDNSTPAFPVTIEEHMRDMQNVFLREDEDLERRLKPAYYGADHLDGWVYPDERTMKIVRTLCEKLREGGGRGGGMKTWIEEAAAAVLFPFRYSEDVHSVFEEVLDVWVKEYFVKSRSQLAKEIEVRESSASPKPTPEQVIAETIFLATGPRTRKFRSKKLMEVVEGCHPLVVKLRMVSRMQSAQLEVEKVDRVKVTAELFSEGLDFANAKVKGVTRAIDSGIRMVAPAEGVPFFQPTLDRPRPWSKADDPRHNHPTIDTQRLLYAHGVEVRSEPRPHDPETCMNIVTFPGEGRFASEKDAKEAREMAGGRRITHVTNSELKADMMRMYSLELAGRPLCYDVLELSAWVLFKAEQASSPSAETGPEASRIAAKHKMAVAHAFVASRGVRVSQKGPEVDRLTELAPGMSIHEIAEAMARMSSKTRIPADLLLEGASLVLDSVLDPFLGWKRWVAAGDVARFPDSSAAAQVTPMTRDHARRLSKWLASYLSLNRIRNGKLLHEEDFYRLGTMSAHLMPEAVVRSEMNIFSRAGRAMYDAANYAAGPVVRLTENRLRSPEFIVAAQIALYLLESLICLVAKLIRIVQLANPINLTWSALVAVLWQNLGSFTQATIRLVQIIKNPESKGILGNAFEFVLTSIGFGSMNVGMLDTAFSKFMPSVYVGRNVGMVASVIRVGLRVSMVGAGATEGIDKIQELIVNVMNLKEFMNWSLNIVQYIPFANDMASFLGFLKEFKQTFANRVDHMTTLSAAQTMLAIKFFCRFSAFLNIIDVATGNMCQNLFDLLSRVFGILSVYTWAAKIIYNIVAFFTGMPFAGSTCLSLKAPKYSGMNYTSATGEVVTANTADDIHTILRRFENVIPPA
jgi:hypothetical protein